MKKDPRGSFCLYKYGRDWTRTNDLTDVNPRIQDRARNVNLPELESFNN